VRSLRIRTPAKINLFLRVLGLRADGYHDIETLFQAIDLYDEIIVSETNEDPRIEARGHPELETEDNLAMRALRWMERETGDRFSVTLSLTKSIPVAAGLGGGSSDAAAALRALTLLYYPKIDEEALRRGAVELGADVAFFLQGGTAVGEGLGEKLTPVMLSVDYGLILVNPGFPVSSGGVYQEFASTLTTPRREGTLWHVLRERRDPRELLENDLQGIAEKIHPEIREARRAVELAGARPTLMSGSGPTVFGIAESDTEHLRGIKRKLPDRWLVLMSRPIETGPIID
jgi:4-diphosphocytidyl-2-C-methyl-D-erythritol kinase